jgi:hypothetical protein
VNLVRLALYSRCWPPPMFILTISILETSVFLYYWIIRYSSISILEISVFLSCWIIRYSSISILEISVFLYDWIIRHFLISMMETSVILLLLLDQSLHLHNEDLIDSMDHQVLLLLHTRDPCIPKVLDH